MSQIGNNNAVTSYAADYQYRTEQAKKNDKAEQTSGAKTGKITGRTIGEPKLSDKAAKYYEKLKAKYSNMDFILVSPEKKQEAESKKGMYQSSKELIVLIDSDKIEKMAEDEEYRAKYEAILSNATNQISQMKSELGSNGSAVKSMGMTFDDHGNASFFAVVDKSLAAQRERITEKKAEAAKEKKAEAKADAEKAAEEKRKEKAEKSGRTEYGDRANQAEYTTVTASSWDELLTKIDSVLSSGRADRVMTTAEKAVGGSIDYTV